MNENQQKQKLEQIRKCLDDENEADKMFVQLKQQIDSKFQDPTTEEKKLNQELKQYIDVTKKETFEDIKRNREIVKQMKSRQETELETMMKQVSKIAQNRKNYQIDIDDTIDTSIIEKVQAENKDLINELNLEKEQSEEDTPVRIDVQKEYEEKLKKYKQYLN